MLPACSDRQDRSGLLRAAKWFDTFLCSTHSESNYIHTASVWMPSS